MKKSALKNRIKSYWGKHKTAIFVVALSLQLAIGLTIYFLFGRIPPNDEIFVPKEGSVAFLMNENPKFSVDFGKVGEPNKQWVRFEAQTSSKNPFEEEKGNIFAKIAKLFQRKERYGIEMSLVGVDLKGENLEKYGDEVILVADVIGTDSVKTSTELVDSGREIGVYEDQEVPVSKQTVLNKDVADGVDLEYQILKGLGLKEEIIIRDLEAYKKSCKEKECSLPLNEFVFDLKMDSDVELKEGWFTIDGQSTSTYYFVDSKGRYIAHFLPNFAIDNINNKTFDVNLKVEKGEGNNYRAKVTVDLEWLLSNKRVFPVRIDPSIVHDETADFSGGIFNRTESVTGPKVQLLTSAFDCTGGTITTNGNYKIHTFTSSGTLTCVGSGRGEVLAVAGGGGGGSSVGGGGGAGGVVVNNSFIISAGNTSVTVGGGGGSNTNGSNSVFSTIVANGGGKGGTLNTAGSNGGSGGGGGSNSGIGSQPGGTGSQGGNGGSSYFSGTYASAGGGGGNGGNGVNATLTVGGNGGAGYNASAFGLGTIAGGGGGYSAGTQGTGTAGGGNGGTTVGGAGTANTGGGGGGAQFTGGTGGTGGSGIVVVQYLSTQEVSNILGEYTSSSMDMGGSMSEAILSWTPSGVNTGNGETPYSTTSMVAQWNLNETSGTTAASGGTCGASCNGTLTNMTTSGQDAAVGTGWTASNKRWGAGALMFDGANDYITTASLGFDYDTITISAWVNPNLLTSRRTIVDLGTETTLVPQLEIGTCNAGTNAVCVMTPGVWQAQTVNNVISTGTWNHIVYTKNGAGATHKIYVNGVEQTLTVNASATYASTAASKKVGSRAGTSQHFNGTLDSLSLYSRVLSAAEILSNYQAGNIEFQYRVSADNSTWSDWTSNNNETSWDDMDNQDQIWDSGYHNDKALVSTSRSVNDGDGADGACSVSSGTVSISTASCSGRGTADAVNFSSTALTSAKATSITVSTTPTGLAAGDEILIINMQGTTTNFSNVGLYETHTISSIATNTLSFTDYPMKYTYDGTTQDIMVQRVPNYTSVTVSSGAIMTADAWNGTKGGVLFFRATGTVTDGGTISMDAKGYAGGAGSTTNATGGAAGESICGNPGGGTGGYGAARTGLGGTCGGGGGAGATTGGLAGTGGAGSAGYGGAGGGGGSGTNLGGNGGGGGGGGYGTYGTYGFATTAGGAQNGVSGGIDVSGNGGNSAASGNYSYEGGGGGGGSYGLSDLFRIYLGAGAGGGGSLFGGNGNYNGGNGGGGGGIIMISADTITISASSYITSDGVNGSAGASGAVGFGGSGGGGAGGTISLIANTVSAGTSLVGAVGGTGNTTNNDGGNGGSGRVAVFYASSMSGAITTPKPFVQKYNPLAEVEGTGSMQVSSGSYVADSNTVALWHLDERGGSGAYIKDSSGNGLHGTPTGTLYTNDSKAGGARDYDTGTTVIAIGTPPPAALNFTTTAFTVEAWINIDSYTQGRYITNCDNGTNGWGFSVGTTGQLRLTTRGTTDVETVGTTVLSAGQWYHVAAVFTGTAGQRRLYINGALDASENYTGSITTATAAFTLGSRASTYFRGSLDEVRVSNIARTADEISESYRLGSNRYVNKIVTERDISAASTLPIYVASDRPGSYLNTIWGETGYSNYQADANTIGLWHLDEITGGGAYVKDYSGLNFHATPTGTAYNSGGKLGGARSFNGTATDYITTGANYNIGASPFTISFWINPTSLANDPIPLSNGSYNVGGVYLQINNAGQVIFYTNQSGAVQASSSAVGVFINRWQLVTITRSGSSVRIYVNGQDITGSAGTHTNPASTTSPFTLGTYAPSPSSYPFAGLLDEVQVSSVARSADEIRQSYEVGLRTHTVQIDFGASLVSGNLITGSGDTSFSIDSTVYGLADLGSGLYVDEKVIVKENHDGTEYIAQGTVSDITEATGAVTVSSWDTGSTFPSAGYTVGADVFKWQREYIPVKNRTVSTHVNAINLLSFYTTNGDEGRNIWIDDLRSTSGYLSTYIGEALTFPSSGRYFQYKAIFNTWDTAVTPYISQVQLDYGPDGPTMDQIMRHGKWFSNGAEQPFWWVNPP